VRLPGDRIAFDGEGLLQAITKLKEKLPER
jgi:hypothetical protein